MTAGDDSIKGRREDEDAASNYDDLVAELEAVEAAVDGSTTAPVKAEVVAMRNKVERPPLKAYGSDEYGGPTKRAADVTAARALVAGLAERV